MNNINEILATAPPLDVLRERMEQLEGRYEAKPFIAETEKQREYMRRVNNPAVPELPFDLDLFAKIVGHQMYVRVFHVRPEQLEVIRGLTAYFSGNPGPYDTEKGIFIYGGTGSGKTTLMRIFQDARFAIRHPVAMTNMPTLYVDMLAEGQMNLQTQREKERIFDDAGAENAEIASFGNRVNLFPQLLLLRYEGQYKTHATSNLTPSEIIQRPGFDDRVKSRMNELFNIVHLPGGDWRRTKGVEAVPY